MWVVKLGGSLQGSPYLQDWIEVFANHGGGKLALVPGGGKYADKVREDQIKEGFSDREAHTRAIGAMEEFARDLCRREPRLQPFSSQVQLAEVLQGDAVPVWLPSEMVIGRPDIPETWEVTSDSLALWLAQTLSAQGLILVKPVRVEDAGSLDNLADSGVIDGYFPTLFHKRVINLVWYTPEQHQQLKLSAPSHR